MGHGTMVRLYASRVHRSNAEEVVEHSEYFMKLTESELIAMAAAHGETVDEAPWHLYVSRRVPELIEEYCTLCTQRMMAQSIIDYPEDAEDDYDEFEEKAT